MSYDLHLRDQVTKEELKVPPHMMHGGNIPCDVINGQLVPTSTTEAYLNITYNYSGYYYDAFPSLEKDPEQYNKDRENYHIKETRGGIRTLNGMTGFDAIPILEEMIHRIECKYKTPDGWIDTERNETWYENRNDNSLRKDSSDMFHEFHKLLMQGMSDKEARKYLDNRWEKREGTILMNEGDTHNYWCPTAANAIRPLYQLITLSKMRPDGIWSEES